MYNAVPPRPHPPTHTPLHFPHLSQKVQFLSHYLDKSRMLQREWTENQLHYDDLNNLYNNLDLRSGCFCEFALEITNPLLARVEFMSLSVAQW